MFLVWAHSCCAPPWEWTKWCKTVFATCFLPRSRCAVPQVFGKEFWDLGPDSIWALVHINSFKCHYKIQGAFYWLSWCSEVCLVHWVGVTLFLFFIKVWIRRERELTQVRETHYTNSAQHQRRLTCRVRNKPQFLQNHMEWEEMPQTVSAAEAGTV